MYSAAALAVPMSLVIFGLSIAGNRRLLDHLAVIAAVQVVQDAADDARVFHQRQQVLAGAFRAGRRPEDAFVEAGGDQVILQRALVLQVLLGLAAVDLVERRLGDIEVAAIDQFAHLPVEEGQQQRADVGAVDVGVRHHDDLVIAQLVGGEVVADAGAERGDQRADLLAGQHLVGADALDIEDLAAQRQHRLEFAVAALLGAAACRVALDDEQFGLGGILFLAVGELAGQRGNAERALARQFARLAGGFARSRSLDHLADDDLGLGRMFLEPGLQGLVEDVLDHRDGLPRKPACPWSARRISGPAPSPTARR